MPTVPGNMIQDLPPAFRVPQTRDITELGQINRQPIEKSEAIALEEAHKQNLASADKAYGDIIKLKDSLIYGPDGALTKKGPDAFDSITKYSPKWEAEKKIIFKDLTPAQASLVEKHEENEFEEFKGALTLHEQAERKNYYKTASDYAIENIRNTGISNINLAPDKLDISWEDQLQELKKQRKYGYIESDQELESKARNTYDLTYGGAIENLLKQGNYNAAQKLYNEKNIDLSPKTKDSLLPALRQGFLNTVAISMENKFDTAYSLPGGNVNLNKIDQEILSMDLSPGEQFNLQNKVKSMARSHIIGNQQIRQSRTDGMLAEMAKAKQEGMSLLDFQNQVIGMTQDPVERNRWLSIVNRNWNLGQDTRDDTALVNQLLTKVVNGQGDPRAEVEEAWNHGNGPLSTKTYLDLNGKITNIMRNGPDNESQAAWKVIRKMATEKYGDINQGLKETDDFMYYVYQHSRGKKSEDLIDFAKQQLDKDPSTGGFLGFGKHELWKTGVQKQKELEPVWNEVKQSIGKNVVDGIVNGLASQTHQEIGINEISDFADHFGGYDSLKVGGPVNRAILWFMQNYPKEPVTKINIEWAMRKMEVQ